MSTVKECTFSELDGALPDYPYYISKGEIYKDYFVHTHDFSELFIILNGEATHLVDNVSYKICAGDVYVIREKTSHGFTNVKHFSICNIMIRDRELQVKYPDLKNLPGYQALFVLEPYYRKGQKFASRLHLDYTSLQHVIGIINDMYAEYYGRHEGYRSMFISGLVSLIIYLSRQYTDVMNASNSKILNLANAVSYMENSFDIKLKMDDLAQKAGMSARNFNRVFKQNYNVTPMEYLQKLRINKTASMLQNTDMSITDIALENGFCDSTHFTRQFKSIFGITPTKFRKIKNFK